MTSWEYTYKRRGWSLANVVRGLNEQSWVAFQRFHQVNQMTCPDKSLYDEAVKSLLPQQANNPKTKTTSKAKTVRKTRTTKPKGATNEGKRQRTRKKTT
tara:strand:+ start:100 stop:396 length:297 start_codon:yes stop_codon:yes gene_type:complete